VCATLLVGKGAVVESVEEVMMCCHPSLLSSWPHASEGPEKKKTGEGRKLSAYLTPNLRVLLSQTHRSNKDYNMSSVATAPNMLGILKDTGKGPSIKSMHGVKADALTEVLVDDLQLQQ
jgi:hypothetical protein